MIHCPACGLPGDHDGPTHAYMSPSAACWAMYGEVLAREYSELGYWKSHRLLVDAYCGHHSVGDDRRARQSLWIHIAALILHFEDSAAEEVIVDFLRRAAKSEDFDALEMPEASRGITIEGIHNAPDVAAHHVAVERYARAVYEAWTPHHAAFRGLIQRVLGEAHV